MANRKSRLTLKDEYVYGMQGMLLRLYAANPDFMQEFRAIGRQYYRLLRLLVTDDHRKNWGISGLAPPVETWTTVRETERAWARLRPNWQRRVLGSGVSRFQASIESLAMRWGLNAPWAAPRLGIALAEPFLFSGSFFVRPTPEGRSHTYGIFMSSRTIDIRVEPQEDETWDEVAERILRAARTQWESIRAEMEQNPAWEVRDTRPELQTHMGWLYRRIVPNPLGRPPPWVALSKEADKASHMTIKHGVERLARELSVSLPKVTAGRPSGRSIY